MKFFIYAAAISLTVVVGVIEVEAFPHWSSKYDNNKCAGEHGLSDCQHSCHNLTLSAHYNEARQQKCTGNDTMMLWKRQNCYRCSCMDGYYLVADGKSCRKASSAEFDCEGNNGLGKCHHSCLNSTTLWGRNNTSLPQLCTGNNCYRCSCRDGFYLAANGKTCQGNASCAGPNGLGDCNQGCLNLTTLWGRNNTSLHQKCTGNDATASWKLNNCYRCSCKDGYYLTADRKTCREITCGVGYYQCPSNSYCISEDFLCDCEFDCEDKSDEANCTKSCPVSDCSQECKNGGTCNNGACDCRPGWKGESCDQKDCNPTCQNNGTCNSAFKCECTTGWEGDFCHIRDCNPTCGNNGTCNAAFECDCTSRWEGASCNISRKTTCMNGYFRCPSDGFCISEDWKCDGEYDCQDKADEKGCTNAQKYCTKNCQNGGTCNVDLECVCDSKWKGEYCHLTICKPACQNNGICNASRTCECASGWEGAHCHLKVPDCNPKCQNGGTCNADSKCDCAPGWEGETCNSVPDCNPKCQNGGTCNADSECDCAPGWEGETCNSETTCDKGYFRCPSNGYCILKSWLCDGEIDCLDDGSDERDCQATCVSLKCSPNGRCTEKEGRTEAFCTCDDGYVSEGKECIATCAALQCSSNGRCTEKIGMMAAFCTCDDGYVFERKGCTECPDGQHIAEQCLKFYFESVSWKEAQTRCETHNESLANLKDPKAFKKHMVDKSNTIESNGSEGSEVQRFWVAGSESSNNKDEWSWLDGRLLQDDFPWANQQRKTHEKREYCLAWDSKKDNFDDKNCKGKMGFICEH